MELGEVSINRGEIKNRLSQRNFHRNIFGVVMLAMAAEGHKVIRCVTGLPISQVALAIIAGIAIAAAWIVTAALDSLDRRKLTVIEPKQTLHPSKNRPHSFFQIL